MLPPHIPTARTAEKNDYFSCVFKEMVPPKRFERQNSQRPMQNIVILKGLCGRCLSVSQAPLLSQVFVWGVLKSQRNERKHCNIQDEVIQQAVFLKFLCLICTLCQLHNNQRRNIPATFARKFFVYKSMSVHFDFDKKCYADSQEIFAIFSIFLDGDILLWCLIVNQSMY